MSVIQRGKKFHYRFLLKGKSYSGVLPVGEIPEQATKKDIETLRRAAVAAESKIYTKFTQDLAELEDKEREIRKNKTVVALVENYKFELSGGQRIALADAMPLAEAKPSRRQAASSYVQSRRTYFADFVAFMADKYPDVNDLSAVRRAHCEAYVTYLTEHGRYIKDVSYEITVGKIRKKKKTITYSSDRKISAKTIKEIVIACRWVFHRLEEDAGIVRDPWREVVLPEEDSTDREVFSPEELRLIWDGMQSDPFVYPLFLVAANSGMTEGDICTLEWSEIDWVSNCIQRDRRKTGADIVLPLLPQLAEYLASLPRTGKYVFPEHAEMYLDKSRRSTIPSRIIRFLNKLGIETRKQVPGRRAVSVKDLHSMRHVFCYMASRAGIPRSSIAKMVGHMDEKMTAHYAAHETAADLNQEIKKLSSPFTAGERIAGIRRQLAELAYSLPEETVRRLVESVTAEAATESHQHLIE